MIAFFLNHRTCARGIAIVAPKMPQPRCARPARHRGGHAAGALLLLLLSLADPATATDETLPGEDVASIRSWLYTHNAQLRALQADADAAEASIFPAGALPDPMGSMELDDIDKRRPSLLPSKVGVTTYRVRQLFPLWGKRELSREVARNAAQAARFERDATALELFAQAEEAYVRYWHAREAVTVIDRLIALLEQVEEVAGVRYAVGLAAQQDSIRAQVERTMMQRERIERLAIRREAIATLNAVLGRPVDAVLAEPAAPPALAIADGTLAAAVARLDHGAHPAVQASAAMATAAGRNVELERRNRYPDLSVSLGAMQRGDRLDGYEVMLEVNIPFQQRARRARERESRLREDAALARTEDIRVALEGRVGSAWARWIGAREQRALIEQTLLPQSDANFKSALASYQVGEVDFGTLLEALRGWQGADLARVDAIRDELLGAAAVRAINGDTQ